MYINVVIRGKGDRFITWKMIFIIVDNGEFFFLAWKTYENLISFLNNWKKEKEKEREREERKEEDYKLLPLQYWSF